MLPCSLHEDTREAQSKWEFQQFEFNFPEQNSHEKKLNYHDAHMRRKRATARAGFSLQT